MNIMLTMQKTVEIPRDRHIHLDWDLTVPGDMPCTSVELMLVVAPASETPAPKKRKPALPASFTKVRTIEECIKEAEAKTAKRIAEGRNPFKELQEGGQLFGGIDGVEFQRMVRNEWPDYWEDSTR